jgi:hypothetical protein
MVAMKLWQKEICFFERSFSFFIRTLFLLCVLYGVIAYGVLPFFWKHYEHHPRLENAPKTTATKEGFAGDPLNIGLVGTREEIIRAFTLTGWYRADSLGIKSDAKITETVVLNRSYPSAPVSNLYVWGRKQDLAFEIPDGKSPRRRHHVRLWQSTELAFNTRPFWIGAATYDRSVGMSHRTGQVTHHISPTIDRERDSLIHDIVKVGQAVLVFQVTGVGPTMKGKNGDGDWYYTDGELSVCVISLGNDIQTTTPQELPSPLAIQLKNQAWTSLCNIFEQPAIMQLISPEERE